MRYLIKTITILAFFVLTLNAQDNSFVSDRANVWVLKGSSIRSFHAPMLWSKNADVVSGNVLVDSVNLSDGALDSTQVIVNHFLSSYPTLNGVDYPALSLVGLDKASWSILDSLNDTKLDVTPDGGVFDNTIKINIHLNATSEVSKGIEYQLDSGAVQTKTLSIVPEQNSSVSFYLSKSGVHTLKYRFVGESFKSLSFTINNSNLMRDSDDDGIPDNIEVELGFDPLDVSVDGNGFSKFDILIRGEDINDSDNDGWSNFDEIYLRSTNPYDANYKPSVDSIYGVEYNLSVDSTFLDAPYDRVSVTNLISDTFYDSKEVLNLALTSDYYNMAISDVIDENLSDALDSGVIPRLRINGSIPSIFRVKQGKDYNTTVLKSFIPSKDDLSVKTYYQSLLDSGVSDIGSADFISGFISYMKDNLVQNKKIVLDNNSSLIVGYLEANLQLSSSKDKLLLINPESSDDYFDYVSRDVNKLVEDLVSIFDKFPLETNGLALAQKANENSSEFNLAEFLQTKLLDVDRYKIALMKEISFDQSQSNISDEIYYFLADSDGDGISNMDEVLASSSPIDVDSDDDGYNDDVDICVQSVGLSCLSKNSNDSDLDGVTDSIDNCPFNPNLDQNDSNNDGIGDVCAQKGLALLSPYYNIELPKGSKFDFEAKRLDGGSEIYWFVDGVIVSSQSSENMSRYFNDIGTFNVCASKSLTLNSLNSSCVDIKILDYNQNSLVNLYAIDTQEQNTDNPRVILSLELSKELSQDKTYTYTTQSSSAIAGEDFIATSGEINLKKGDKRYFFSVEVKADTIYEPDEYFYVALFDSSNNQITRKKITIYNDDLVADNNNSSSNNFSDKFFFSFDDGVHGEEPWYLDQNSQSSAHILYDMVENGDSSPKHFTQMQDNIFFVAKDLNGILGLYLTDTSAKTPTLIESFTSANSIDELNVVDNKLYFLVHEDGVVDQLYVSDGLSASFVTNIADDYVFNSSQKHKLLVSGLKIYIISQSKVGADILEDIYLYDTRDSTYTLFKDMPDTTKALDNLISTSDGFYFSFGSSEVWYSDKEDAQLFVDINNSSKILNIKKVDNMVYVLSSKVDGTYLLYTKNIQSGEVKTLEYSEAVELYTTSQKAYLVKNSISVYDINSSTPFELFSVAQTQNIDEVSILNDALFLTTNSGVYNSSGTEILSLSSTGNIKLFSNNLHDYIFAQVNDSSLQNGNTYSIEMIDTRDNSKHSIVQNDVAPYFTSADTFYIDENVRYIEAITTDDINSTLSLGSGGDESFVSLNNGVLELLQNSDYETKQNYSVELIAEDINGHQSTQLISVIVRDLDEIAPVFTSANTFTMDENQKYVGLITTDDINSTLALSGVDASLFSLVDGNLSLHFNADYESKSSYSIVVTATDKVGNSSTQNINISVNDLYETSLIEGKIFFAFDDGIHGEEPWYCDVNDSNNTHMLKDIDVGIGSSYPDSFINVGKDDVYFTTINSDRNISLYITKGSDATTSKVGVIVGDYIADSVDVNGTLYFVVHSYTNEVVDKLYKSDGVNITYLTDIANDFLADYYDVKKMTLIDGKLYIIHQSLDGVNRDEDIYTFDIATQTYSLFKDMPSDANGINFLSVDANGFYFIYSNKIYFSDKTALGTVVETTLTNTSEIEEMVIANGVLYINARSSSGDLIYYVYDTVSKQLTEENYFISSDYIELFVVDDTAYMNYNGDEIFSLNGTSKTSVFTISDGDYIDQIFTTKDKFYFTTFTSLFDNLGTEVLYFEYYADVSFVKGTIDNKFLVVTDEYDGLGNKINFINGVNFNIVANVTIGAEFTSTNYTFVDENTLDIIQVTTDDPNANIYLTQDSASMFDLAPDGTLSFKVAPDYENGDSFYMVYLYAIASNSAVTYQDFEVSINNVAEVVPSINPFSGTVDENLSISSVVGSVSITHMGDDTPIDSMSLSGIGSDDFTINPSGVISVAKALDYETKDEYNLSVVAHNAAGDSASVAVNIAINDVVERDALLTQIARVIPNDYNENKYFGSSIDIDGEYVVVGDSYESYVYIFKRDGNDTLTEVSKFRASNTVSSDLFGDSVVIKGTTIIVSAPQHTSSTNAEGSAYIFAFDRASGSVTQTQTLSIVTNEYALFSKGIAFDGEYLFLGVPSDSSGGKVYFYTYDAATHQASSVSNFTSSSLSVGDKFGYSIALDHKNLIISAYNKDVNSKTKAGEAYLFRVADDNLSVTQKAIIHSSDYDNYDKFSQAVSMSGSYVVLGSPYDDDTDISTGSAYLFKIADDNNSINFISKIVATDPNKLDVFGYSLDMDENRVVIGTQNGESAYVYDINSSDDSLNLVQKLKSNIDYDGSVFGSKVSIDNSTIAIGASGESKEYKNGGSAYIFDDIVLNKIYEYSADDSVDIYENFDSLVYRVDVGSRNQPITYSLDGDDASKFSLNENNISLVSSLNYESPSDLNGDNIYDISIVAEDFKGYTYTKAMSINILDEYLKQNDQTNSNELNSDALGYSVDISGDIVVAGIPFSDQNFSNGGLVKIYVHNPDKLDYLGSLSSSDVSADDNFGKAVAILGDYIIVGAPGAVPRGAIYVYKRNGYLTPTLLTKFTPSDTGDTGFGNTISISSSVDFPNKYYFVVGSTSSSFEAFSIDITNDSISRILRVEDPYALDYTDNSFASVISINNNRILVSAPDRSVIISGTTYTNAGVVYKYDIGKLGTGVQETIKLANANSNDHFGSSLAITQDYIAIGASGRDSVDVYEDIGLSLTHKYTLTPNDASNISYGSSVALNNTMLLVGAKSDDKKVHNGGSVYVYSLDAQMDATLKQKISSSNSSAYMGSSISLDASETIIGSPGFNQSRGRVDLFSRDTN